MSCRRSTTVVRYFNDPINDVPNRYIHRQFQGGLCSPPPPPPRTLYYPTHGRGYFHVRHGSMLSLCVFLKLLWFQWFPSRREKLAKARNNLHICTCWKRNFFCQENHTPGDRIPCMQCCAGNCGQEAYYSSDH